MPFKTSCFNGTLFRKTLSRYWPLWGMSAFFGAMFPLAVLVNQLKVQEEWYPLEITEIYYNVLVYIVPVLSFLYAGLCAMAVWNYLYFPRSVGLMHTLPIRREGLFCTGVLSGLTMMAIPYAVTGVLTVAVTSVWGGFEPAGIAVTVLGVIGESLFFFGLATFCAFLVGNILMLPALYILLNFLAVLIEYIIAMIAGGFCFGLTGSYSGALDPLSPLVHLLRGTVTVHTAQEEVAVDAFTTVRRLTEVRLEGAWIVGVYAAAGAVLLAVSFFLYRRRRSESAGDMVSAPWMRPIFRFGYAALAALLGGRLLYAMFWEAVQSTEYFDPVPMTLCMMVCACVGYLSANMALAKSPRVWKQSWRGMLAAAAGCIVLTLGLEWDLLGIERRVPDPSQVERVHVYAAEGNFFLYGGEDDALIGRVTEAHRAVARDKAHVLDYNARWDRGELDGEADDLAFVYLELNYTLKGGRSFQRSYALPLLRSRLGSEGTYETRLDALVNDPVMAQKRLRWRDTRQKIREVSLTAPMLERSETLSSREYTAVIDAVAEDAAAGRWGRWEWFDRGMYADVFAGRAYPVTVNIKFAERTLRKDDTVLIPTTAATVYVHPRMSATVAALKDLGLVTDLDLIPRMEYRPWDFTEDMEAGQEEYDRFCEVFGMTPEEYYRQNAGQYPAGWFDGTGEGWADAA